MPKDLKLGWDDGSFRIGSEELLDFPFDCPAVAWTATFKGKLHYAYILLKEHHTQADIDEFEMLLIQHANDALREQQQ